jgi:membrane-associated phospholipid phosphatase
VWLNRQLFEVGAPRIVRVFNWAWCVGIAYSTLATKQHVAVDMVAGVILGMSAAALSLAQSSLLIRQSRVPLEIERRQES